MSIKRLLVIIFLFFLCATVFPQSDYEFWFAAPPVTHQFVFPSPILYQNLNHPIRLYFTTAEGPATVTISQPANPSFTPIVVIVNNPVATAVDLTNFIDNVETKPADSVINWGLHITSNKRITAFYEVQSPHNAETWPLLGRNALGYEFIIPSQQHYSNYQYSFPPALNSFEVVATEDSTIVKVLPKVGIVGHVSNDTVFILLNRGQSWNGSALSGDSTAHLAETFVFANKPVAVTVSDDAIHIPAVSNNSEDIAGVQLIPRHLSGKEFAFSAFGNGFGYSNKIYMYAYENSTTIIFNDSNRVISRTINRGDSMEVKAAIISGIGNMFHIQSDKPILVIQYSFSDQVYPFGFTSPQATSVIVPPITCGGSRRVVSTSTPPSGKSPIFEFYIVTNKTNLPYFTINPSGSLDTNIYNIIPGTFGSLVSIPSGGFDTWPLYTTFTVTNSKGRFQLCLEKNCQATDTADFAKSSFVSDYSTLYLGADKKMCPGDSILLDAGYGRDTYLWNTGDTTQTIWARHPGIFWVHTTEEGNCSLSDTIAISYYSFTPVNLGPDRQICNGDSSLLDAGVGRSWYDWSTGDSTQSIWVKTTGIYWIKVSDVHCPVFDTIVVSTTPVPVITNNPLSKFICSGESTNIHLTANVPVTTFHWTVTLTSGNITGYSPDSGLIINQILINALATPGVVTYHITPKVGSCTGSIVDFLVTVNPGDSVKVSISASTNNICAGTPVTFTAIPTNGGASPSYLWKVNGTSIGPDNPVFSYSPNNGDVVLCILTSSIGVCTSNNPATSNSITMVVNLLLPVSVNVTPSLNPSCAGNPVTFIATPTNGGTTPTYLWKVNGNSVGTNSPAYTFTPVSGDLIFCIMTSSETCATNNPASSNIVVMVVNPNLPVSVSISASANPFCQGASVTFTANPTNGGVSPFYQWKVNGMGVGPNSPVYMYSPNNGDVVSCVMNSSIACPNGNPATSNSITMVENNNSPVNISINVTANPICSGTSVTFTATPTNGGITPAYQWTVNGITVGTNSPVYVYSPTNGDVVICSLTSNLFCASGNPASSNIITMTVNPNLPVSIAINTSANPVCTGTQVTFAASPINPGTLPVYQWKVNGANVGTNQPTYTCTPNFGDQISCILTSNAICPSGNPATSNTIVMTVNPNLPVSVSVTVSNNPVCAGIPVTFTATPTNGGASPFYQWKVNGISVGVNSAAYQYTPTNGDIINCILTSNVLCPTGNPATSNLITMNISALPVVTYTLCNDSITTITAQPFKLKDGIPLNGNYSGPGVNSGTGIFSPLMAGIGIKTLTYTYTNAALCSTSATRTIMVLAAPVFICGNNLTDIRDNKAYPTVQIGSQCWMASNLNYGTLISGNTVQRDNCLPEKYCYNDLNINCGLKTYYQWDELMQYDEVVSRQGLCPPGWHVPTEADWNILFSNFISNAFAASPLKYSGFSGFDALLSGAEHQNKNWDYQGFATFFWSSTLHSSKKALAHGMNDIDPSVSLYPSLRSNAFSVRCLKD